MPEQVIRFYQAAGSNAILSANPLCLEISNECLVCMEKNGQSGEVDGLEVFSLPVAHTDWAKKLDTIKPESKLLGKSYNLIDCFYNFPEALLIPDVFFSAEKSADYLSLVYGDNPDAVPLFDTVFVQEERRVIAYRIPRALHEWMKEHFLLARPRHIYSNLLAEVSRRQDTPAQFIKLQVYHTHIIIGVFLHAALQIVQYYPILSDDDILYHLAALRMQYQLDDRQSVLEISGHFTTGSKLHKLLQPLFGLIQLESAGTNGVFGLTGNYPSHYFTPYFNLVS